jgi:hypothetical protein
MIDTEPIYQLGIRERQRRTTAPRSHHVARREVAHAQIELQATGEMVSQGGVETRANSIVTETA